MQLDQRMIILELVTNLSMLKLWLSILLLQFNVAVYATDSDIKNDHSLSQQRRSELHNLLVQDCGSCHGMTMKGGLGPALTPEVLMEKPRQMVEMTILNGRPGTPMPPWNTILTTQEVHWLVDRLYTGILP